MFGVVLVAQIVLAMTHVGSVREECATSADPTAGAGSVRDTIGATSADPTAGARSVRDTIGAMATRETDRGRSGLRSNPASLREGWSECSMRAPRVSHDRERIANPSRTEQPAKRALPPYQFAALVAVGSQPAARCASTAAAPSSTAPSSTAPSRTAPNSTAPNSAAPSNPATPAARPFEMTSQLSPSGGFRCDPRGCIAPVFALALRVDMLYRPGPTAFGIGGFLSTRTDNFRDLSTALGASLLVPVSPTFPLVFSLGGAGRVDEVGLSGALLERVEWGPRSYNYQSAYVLSGGLFAEARQWIVGANNGYDFVFGVDIDLELTAIPFIALYTWIARTDRRH